jgi:hypothetical protein
MDKSKLAEQKIPKNSPRIILRIAEFFQGYLSGMSRRVDERR